MRVMSADEVRAWLRRNGVPSTAKIEEIIDGFDFAQPVYLQHFEPDQELYQFIRGPSAQNSSPMAGNWFCLKGATTSQLAIIDGLTGRRLLRYRIVCAFTTLEGTARKQPIQWSWSGGGPGGATQVYVPSPLLRACIVACGARDRW